VELIDGQMGFKVPKYQQKNIMGRKLEKGERGSVRVHRKNPGEELNIEKKRGVKRESGGTQDGGGGI